MLTEIRIYAIVNVSVHLNDFNLLPHALDHVFHTNINAYCQQNRYVRFAMYTDSFTLRDFMDSLNLI